MCISLASIEVVFYSPYTSVIIFIFIFRYGQEDFMDAIICSISKLESIYLASKILLYKFPQLPETILEQLLGSKKSELITNMNYPTLVKSIKEGIVTNFNDDSQIGNYFNVNMNSSVKDSDNCLQIFDVQLCAEQLNETGDFHSKYIITTNSVTKET